MLKRRRCRTKPCGVSVCHRYYGIPIVAKLYCCDEVCNFAILDIKAVGDARALVCIGIIHSDKGKRRIVEVYRVSAVGFLNF